MQEQTDLEEFWDDLLAFIEERRVVPIVGADLATMPDGMPLREHLALRLAERLRVNDDTPAPHSLNDVVCAYVSRRGRREDVFPRLRTLAKEVVAEPPPALVSLARISDFNLFVTLGFDSLLVDALNRERFGSEPRTQHIGYSPQRPADLPAPQEALVDPVVYALLGRVSAAPDYVITDEDLLEFLSALQSDSRRPNLLFDALQSSHLLMIGCNFPDWLARFFIRITKNRPLSVQRSEAEFVVEERLTDDRSLVVFLEHFSYGTRIVPMAPTTFVAELERRWLARRRPGPAAPAITGREPEADAPHSPIFLSYARDDSEAAERLYRRLDALGLDVWYDRDRLESGDAYEQKIRRQVRSCAFFVALISRRAEQREEGFFRREWRQAEERMRGIADHVPFVLPVAVDDVNTRGDGIPEPFRKLHWARLEGGVATPEFETRIVQLVREHSKRRRGLA
ncbi:MAG: toll/interleukin-1 receptor domain-containing protein [Burkholderiales bacterium]|nr:toll/interleukin-1 receptor domain-containing protein [Burkholderiales bacterium]